MNAYRTHFVQRAVVIVVMLIACVGSAAAQSTLAGPTVTLLPSHDTLIDPNNPTTNYNADRLEVTYSNFPNFTATRQSLLQFDLAAVTEPLTTAQLQVSVVESNLLTGGSVTLTLYRLADGWDEASVTWENRPATGDRLQTITVNAGFTGALQFNDPAVGIYLEAERTGDRIASFLLILDGGAEPLGFGGNLLLENSEGAHDGMNGNEPVLASPGGQALDQQLYLPFILR